VKSSLRDFLIGPHADGLLSLDERLLARGVAEAAVGKAV
jgi:hypothetical protein